MYEKELGACGTSWIFCIFMQKIPIIGLLRTFGPSAVCKVVAPVLRGLCLFAHQTNLAPGTPAFPH
jgi:hypothetical protein